MSFNNIIPSWLLVADSIINQYDEGRIGFEEAETKLISLCVPESMINRLYKIENRKDDE